MEPLLGEIKMFGGNFEPRGWAFCNGQLLPIAQNTALFSLLGTTYGGNGQTTFALPDLRGRAPLHFGTGPGLTPKDLGELAGSENVTLIASQMPAHNHQLTASNQPGGTDDPTNTVPAKAFDQNAGNVNAYVATAPNVAMNPTAMSVAGSSQPHDNMQPYLAVNFIIALEGVFPSRN